MGMDLGDTALEEGMYWGNSPTSSLEKGTALGTGMVKGNSFWEGMYGKNVCRCRPLLLQWISEPKWRGLICMCYTLSECEITQRSIELRPNFGMVLLQLVKMTFG